MKNILIGSMFLLLLMSAHSQNAKTDHSDAFRLIEVWLDVQKDYENLPGISDLV